MPVFLIWPLLGGAVGFSAGFLTGANTKKVVTVAALGGAGYLTYKALKGGK